MKTYSIYIDREDSKKVEEEERNSFVRGILEEIGLPLDDCWPDLELTIEQKIELRKLLSKFDVVISDDGDRGIEIYVGKELIAKWYKPTFMLKKDLSEIEQSKKLFYEMIIKHESLFEYNDENEE